MWIGHRISGRSISRMGIRESPAMGTCIAKMYPSAFCRLSKIRRPMALPATIDAKLSSSRTSEAASRATSVPFSPMAIPIWAAFRAGASLMPSPVMATISPFLFRAFTIISFCSGTTLAKTFTFCILVQSSASVIIFNSGPLMHVP